MDNDTLLRAQVRDASRWWWVFVVTGIIWLMLSLVVLRFTEMSPAQLWKPRGFATPLPRMNP